MSQTDENEYESKINQVKSELEREKQLSQKLYLTIDKLESKIEKLSDQLEILNKSIVSLQNEKKDHFELLKTKEKKIKKVNKAKEGAKIDNKSKNRISETQKQREMPNDDHTSENTNTDTTDETTNTDTNNKADNTLSPSQSRERNSAIERVLKESNSVDDTVNTSVYTDANTANSESHYSDENPTDSEYESEVETESKESTLSQKNKIKRSNKIPPIDIWTENRAEIQRIIQNNFPQNSCIFGRINNGKFRIFPKSSEVRDKLLTFIKKRSYQFNTYTASDSKMINIIVKGLDHIDDQTIIEEELSERGIVPYKITKFITGYMRKNNVKSNLWLIVLHPNTETKALFEIKVIDQAIVKFEYLKKPKIIQCKRCQRFNHSASNCNLPYRCVKCTKEHEPGCCKNDTDINKFKPKCVNCQGNHTANDAKNCPIFQKILTSKNKKENEKKKRVK